MEPLSADVAILMPKISDFERFSIRYAGLSEELGALSVAHFFANSHNSFDPRAVAFANVIDVHNHIVAGQGRAPVIRDLTMPSEDKPLYGSGLHLVHHPDTNAFLADKSNLVKQAPEIHPATALATARNVHEALDIVPGERVIIKPVRGMVSKGVQIVSKHEAANLHLADGKYLVQEFIDTSRGIPSMGIEGVHNLRTISIGGVAVGSIARVGGKGGEILSGDIYGAYVSNDQLSDRMHDIIDTVHDVLATQPGDNRNVIAIDLMRGLDSSGEMVDVACEVNRRPMRISAYDMDKDNLDEDAIRTLAEQWDRAEAAMLAGMVA